MSDHVFNKFFHPSKLFAPLITTVCLSYLAVQLLYIAYAVFSVDDFWLAYHTNQFKTGMPYRDFSPYKSVLGYYVFLLPISLFHGTLSPLLYSKAWIALLNTLFLIGSSLWLKKFFSAKAVFASLLLLITTPIFLFFSSEIRVDMLAYWFCLISVLFLLDKKYILAGVSIGLGFLISQKSIWYFIATNAGLFSCWIINERSGALLKNILLFNISTFLILSLYIGFWSYYSDLHTVLRSLFYEPYLISTVDWYAPARFALWCSIIEYSAEIVLLCPLALLGLMFLPVKNRLFIIVYSFIILLFIANCRHPFIYYPIAAVPAIFVLFSAYFTAIELYFYPPILKNARPRKVFNWLVTLGLLLLIIWPISRFFNKLPYYDGRYQRSMVHLMANLLNDGGYYIAGVPLLMDIEQPVPGLVHLVPPGISYITQPSKALKDVLSLSSMYLKTVTVSELTESIKTAPIKLYVDNNRLHRMPKALHHYLDTQFQHYWGSIYLYAPQIPSGHQNFRIKFAGHYQVKASSPVSIDHKAIKPNSILQLSNKNHSSDASKSYRLVLIPNDTKTLLDPKYKNNDWERLIPL